jgi:hypothetical protein
VTIERALALLALGLFACAGNAWAYIDPNVSALVAQGLVAALGAVAIAWRQVRAGLRFVVARLKRWLGLGDTDARP